jgi:hypothetical protein
MAVVVRTARFAREFRPPRQGRTMYRLGYHDELGRMAAERRHPQLEMPLGLELSERDG